jgi:hypothetical protein
MGVIAEAMGHNFVKISVAFRLNCFIQLFIIFHINLLNFFGHKTDRNMGQEETFSNEIWWSHLFLRGSLAHETALLDALDGLGNS